MKLKAYSFTIISVILISNISIAQNRVFGVINIEEEGFSKDDVFIYDDNNKFLIGNPSTAGRGLTLNEAKTVVYYANDFDLDIRSQSEDRCHRIGQTSSVLYIDLICEKTIDEKIIKSLKNKIKIGAKVLGEDASEWLVMTQKQ